MTDWLDNVTMEAIRVLNEPDGSNKAEISKYIEKRCWVPPNLQRLLPAKLRSLTAEGKLFKDKKKYRIASTLPFPRGRRNVVILGPRICQPKICQPKILTMADVQKDLEKMKTMNAEEAAAFASAALQEAEESLKAAEEAQREAEDAEKEAEEAMAFAKALSAKVKGKRKGKMIGHKGRRDFPGKP